MVRSIVSAMLVVLMAVTAHAASGYHVIKKLHVDEAGGWDYLTVDSSANRLYLSRGTHVMVIDTVTGKVIGDLPDTPGVHGIALVPELRSVFTSNGKANTATIFDKDTYQATRQIRTGEDPDAILYEPYSLRVFTFNGKSNDATVISATTGSILGTIPLGGKPEYAATDNNGRVFVNIEDTSEVVELDSRTLLVTKRHSLKPCEAPTGMAIDIEHHRIFSGCRNKTMAVLDVNSGKVIATVPIGEGVDGVAFDPETGLAFSSNGDGTLTVVRESSPGTFETETVPTQRGARTMALDPKTHLIYLPAAEFEPVPVSEQGAAKKRPAITKGSFVLLIVGK